MQFNPNLSHSTQIGLVSQHLFLRFRQVKHPIRDLFWGSFGFNALYVEPVDEELLFEETDPFRILGALFINQSSRLSLILVPERLSCKGWLSEKYVASLYDLLKTPGSWRGTSPRCSILWFG